MIKGNALIAIVEQLARAAGQELRQRFRTNLTVSYKADTSLVTDADLASDRVISDGLRKHFPQDGIYSEENATQGLKGLFKPGQRVWIIDPLDGTSNYANNLPYFCVSIGSGVVRADAGIDLDVGVVYAPMNDELFSAEKTKGARKNGVPLPALASRRPKDFSRNFLVTGFYYTKGVALNEDIERFARIAQECQTIRRMGAAALDLALVAEGVFDAFWERGLKEWDFAAASVIISEVGGVVRNYSGNTLNLYGDGLVAGKPDTVDRLRKLL